MKTLRHGMMWSHLFLQNINIVTRGKIKHFYQIWERDHEVSMSAMMVRIERYNNYRYNTKGNLWNLVNNQIWDINMEETKKVISVVCWGQFALTPRADFAYLFPTFYSVISKWYLSRPWCEQSHSKLVFSWETYCETCTGMPQDDS